MQKERTDKRELSRQAFIILFCLLISLICFLISMSIPHKEWIHRYQCSTRGYKYDVLSTFLFPEDLTEKNKLEIFVGLKKEFPYDLKYLPADKVPLDFKIEYKGLVPTFKTKIKVLTFYLFLIFLFVVYPAYRLVRFLIRARKEEVQLGYIK